MFKVAVLSKCTQVISCDTSWCPAFDELVIALIADFALISQLKTGE